MAHPDKFTPPDKSKLDSAHVLVKAGLSAIPVLGGPAAELFSFVLAPPIEKRRNEWMNTIAESLKTLEEKVEGFKIENLKNNDSFVTCVLHATQSSIRNHQKEKLEALRNAVLNTALQRSPADDIQIMFLNFVDDLTPWHLRLLKFFDDPADWVKTHNIAMPSMSMCGMGTILENVFSELRGQRNFYDLLGRDLHSRGLISGANFHTTGTFSGIFVKSTTDMGRHFISFISSPSEIK